MDRVLLADDDRAIRESLTAALELNGYEVTSCSDGVEALAAYRADPVDVIVLDVMMPGIDGLGVCRLLRAEGDQIPILMLTARVETADRVAGLDAGADDYVPKPYEIDEVLARLRALLRRSNSNDDNHDLRIGDLRLSPAARRVWRGADEIELSKTEFDLLELLMLNAGIVLERPVIYERIWGYDFGSDSKNLAVYIGYLRRKLNAPGEELIRSVRGVGYSLRAS